MSFWFEKIRKTEGEDEFEKRLSERRSRTILSCGSINVSELNSYIEQNYRDPHAEPAYPEFTEETAAMLSDTFAEPMFSASEVPCMKTESSPKMRKTAAPVLKSETNTWNEFSDFTPHTGKLNERIRHMSDSFSEYLIYLIADRGMTNAEVYKRAVVDKKTFSKLKNNADYHPDKRTALSLCVGAKLNLDETRDLLARAGYALSPCDKTDIIFAYFIENGIYDMIELDIQLEEHGLPCVIA